MGIGFAAGLAGILGLIISLIGPIVVIVWGARAPEGTPRRFLMLGGVLLLVQAVLGPLWAYLSSFTYQLSDPMTIAAIANVANLVMSLIRTAGILCLGWAALEAIRNPAVQLNWTGPAPGQAANFPPPQGTPVSYGAAPYGQDGTASYGSGSAAPYDRGSAAPYGSEGTGPYGSDGPDPYGSDSAGRRDF